MNHTTLLKISLGINKFFELVNDVGRYIFPGDMHEANIDLVGNLLYF